MRCVFTMGKMYENANKENVFIAAKLKDEHKVWCGSGVDSLNPAQRLAENPFEMLKHYKQTKFDELTNVKPDGHCMKSLMDPGTCPQCKAKQFNDCKSPRTWVIGSRIHFTIPKVRGKLPQVARTRNRVPRVFASPRTRGQVAPLQSSLETKKE